LTHHFEKICLASSSPRRSDLLRQAGIQFEVLVSGVDETPLSNEMPEHYVRRLALEKARDVYHRRQQQHMARVPVLGADTAVILAGEILGKPIDRAEAEAMLAKLSGKTHEVLSAVALVYQDKELVALSRSLISFVALTREDIATYCDTGEPVDKAGAYGIQGKAATFIRHIEGSYSGVVGLPLYEVTQLLKQLESEL